MKKIVTLILYRRITSMEDKINMIGVSIVDDNTSSLALERAAQAWCTDKTSHIEMDTDLVTAFAEILDEVWSKPWLGNATTRELIEELSARSDLDYKTTTGDDW